MENATDYDDSRSDALHTPFYSRIKRRERKYGWIEDYGNGHTSAMYVTDKYLHELELWAENWYHVVLEEHGESNAADEKTEILDDVEYFRQARDEAFAAQ